MPNSVNIHSSGVKHDTLTIANVLPLLPAVQWTEPGDRHRGRVAQPDQALCEIEGAVSRC